jgi:hypothetical protein
MNDQELQNAAAKEAAQFHERGEPVILRLDWLEAWTLLGQLQLALRHPMNVGPSAVVARQLIATLKQRVATTPALAEVARRGDDRRFDVPRRSAPRDPRRI